MRAELSRKQKRMLGDRLVRERSDRLLTLGEMAALIGMEKATLSKVERGLAPLRFELVRRIIAFKPELLKGIVHPDVLNTRGKEPPARRYFEENQAEHPPGCICVSCEGKGVQP